MKARIKKLSIKAKIPAINDNIKAAVGFSEELKTVPPVVLLFLMYKYLKFVKIKSFKYRLNFKSHHGLMVQSL